MELFRERRRRQEKYDYCVDQSKVLTKFITLAMHLTQATT
jgi:hypothetical protein